MSVLTGRARHPIPGTDVWTTSEASELYEVPRWGKSYFSVGGGFVVREGDLPADASDGPSLPYAFESAAELIAMGERTGLRIDEIVRANERAWREALTGFADPAGFTTDFYQTHVAGKRRAEGARAVLERLGGAGAADHAAGTT